MYSENLILLLKFRILLINLKLILRKMEKKLLDLRRYGMIFCPRCYGQGYMEDPRLQCCPVCKGFGLIKKPAPADAPGPNASIGAWMPTDFLG